MFHHMCIRITLCFLFASSWLLASETNWQAHFDFIEKQMSKGEIVSKVLMKEFLERQGHKTHFTSEVYLVTFSSGIRAVLKFADSEWPDEAVAEVAAYKASCFLDLDLVPPTIFYEQDERIGTLQYYIEPCCDLMEKGVFNTLEKEIPKNDRANIALFDFIFGQWDRDCSNLIAFNQGGIIRFACIDNAAIGSTQKVRYGDYPCVLRFPKAVFFEEDFPETFPFDNIKCLPADPEVWKREYGAILADWQIDQLCKLNKPIYFVIWDGRFWHQFRFGTPAYTDFYPENTMHRLEQLNEEILEGFFQNNFGVFFSKEFIHDILERRDQVLMKLENPCP